MWLWLGFKHPDGEGPDFNPATKPFKPSPLGMGSGFITLALASPRKVTKLGQEEEHVVRIAKQRNPAHSMGLPEGVKPRPLSVS